MTKVDVSSFDKKKQIITMLLVAAAADGIEWATKTDLYRRVADDPPCRTADMLFCFSDRFVQVCWPMVVDGEVLVKRGPEGVILMKLVTAS